MIMSMATIWPLGFLVAAVIDDLCFKKFHNWLFLSLTFLGFTLVFLLEGMNFLSALSGFFLGGLLMLPLVLIGAIGAGDMKFMMCFGILTGPKMIFEVFIFALFWGALIGVLKSLFAGTLTHLVQNLNLIAYKLKPNQTQKIPYTVAILFGWLTHSMWGGFL